MSVSKHGDALLAADAMDSVRAEIVPLATVLTPNLTELGPVAGVDLETVEDRELAAKVLLDAGARGCSSRAATTRVRRRWTCCTVRGTDGLRARPGDNRHTHGTGCTLASRDRVVPGAWVRRTGCGGRREGVRDRGDRGRVRTRWRDRSGRSRVAISREWQLSEAAAAGRRVLRAVRVQLRHRGSAGHGDALIRQAAECSMALTKAAAGPDPDVVRLRPEPEVWSAIEYACHVRDVLEVQRQRIAQCLAEDRPVYAPMDRTGRVKQAQVRGPGPDGGRGRADAVRPRVRCGRSGAHAAAAGRLGLYNYPVRAPRSLGWVIRHTAHEIQHHRHDITTILAQRGAADRPQAKRAG